MNVIQLHYVTGDSTVIMCSYCGASLHDQRARAVASTVAGTKFFCKVEPDMSPTDSCYLMWRRSHR